MDLDTLLTDTFAAHEDLAPSEAAILAGVRRRTSRRGPVPTRAMAVAASVAVVAATAATVVLLGNGHRSTQSATAPANQRSVTADPRSASVSSAVDPAPRIQPLTMPFDLGWMPDGTITYNARRINNGGLTDDGPVIFDAEYLMTVTTSAARFDVDVAQTPGDVTGAAFKSGAGRAVTIDGRPGIESAHADGPGGYEIYFEDSTGGTMYVNVGPDAEHDSLSAAELTAIGRRVADGVRYPGTAQVRPTFGLGYVPAGLRMLDFDVELPLLGAPRINGESGLSTSYEIGTAQQRVEDHIDVSELAEPNRQGARPGRPVQGHATLYQEDHSYRTLIVLGAVGTDAVVVSGPTSQTELYRIGDGLILP